MKRLLLPILLLLAGMQVHASHLSVAPSDSVGVALKNGNYFIIHEVSARQTLYALSKAYSVPIQEIMEANPGMLPAVQAGQLLYIPLKNFTPPAGLILSSIQNGRLVTVDGAKDTPEPPPAKEEKAAPAKPTEPAPQPKTNEDEETKRFDWNTYKGETDLYHEVKSGETLYKIAYYYSMGVQEIMDLNGLENSLISKGQQLLIKKATPKAPSKQDKKEPAKEKPVTEKPAEKPVEKKETEEPQTPATGKEITETGWALVIDKNFPEADKNIALHLKAAVGTIILVTNPANGKTVYVRVVGRLQTDDTDLLLMISPEAARELSAVGSGKVKLKLSYAQ